MTREDAIKHLENMKWLLGVNNTTVDDIPLTKVIDDIITLLKAHEPRVMDFDDVVGGDECWLEAINGACGYADCYACTGTGEVQVFRCKHDNPQYIMARDYLKTWRCWTSRPDEKRRVETPWQISGTV